MNPRPFKIAVSEQQLDDLLVRLKLTRMPRSLDAGSWDDGASLAFMERLISHWRPPSVARSLGLRTLDAGLGRQTLPANFIPANLANARTLFPDHPDRLQLERREPKKTLSRQSKPVA